MATIAFSAATSYAASALSIEAGSTAMMLMTAGGALAGAVVDSMLFSGGGQRGPRLTGVEIQNSTEGTALKKAYGRTRMAGEIIWSTRYLEHEQSESGGKGTSGGSQGTVFTYSVSFAVGLCEGPIVRIGRIWADGKPMDLSGITYRIYTGTETQLADTKIVAVEGATVTPAYRGLCYVVFEDLDLTPYGNRIPQLNFEVYSNVGFSGSELESKIKAVNIIPATGEYVYDPTIVKTSYVDTSSSGGWSESSAYNGSTEYFENQHNTHGLSDWTLAINDLEATCPNLTMAQLVVGWFGSDLRAASCTIKPKVEYNTKNPADATNTWYCSNLSRGSADLVSRDGDILYYGGTPSDLSVYRAIQDLNARGKQVAFYPFVLMDIPPTNTLPDPYSNNAAATGQSAFPWRGRITVSPAIGYTGTPDLSASAATQVNTFFGSAAVSDFGTWNGSTIPYTGPTEWSYRRMILHYAKLCAAAGGVDVFFIGSEMVQLLAARSATSTYPAVSKMVTLAADVSSILGSGTKVSYAADWSEWNLHQGTDGSSHFHLDPLWASSDIDFVSIDNYLPLSDWRDTPNHLDAATATSIYSQEYLQSNIYGGENYDWYYASTADRNTQTRTAITDGAYSEPWIYRRKDFYNWWSRQHYNRPGGTRSGTPTSWVPQSKPIVFSELGCPAINKGSNQPNVFVDVKSSESALPYYSTGSRDDAIQQSYITAWLDFFADSANNPTSSVYSAPMITMSQIALWCWDARPYPEFPRRKLSWGDAENYKLGHWLSGRLNQIPLSMIVDDILSAGGIDADTSTLSGLVTGYVIDSVMTPKAALEPLATAFLFDCYESQGMLRFRHKGGNINAEITDTQLIAQESSTHQGAYLLERTPEVQLPRQLSITYTNESNDYLLGTVTSRRLAGSADNIITSELPLVSIPEKIQPIADILLMDAWISRETLSCTLPPSYVALDPSDVIEMTLDGVTNQYRIDSATFRNGCELKLVQTDTDLYTTNTAVTVNTSTPATTTLVAPVFDFLDLPLLSDTEVQGTPYIAAFAAPWAPLSAYRSPTASSYVLDGGISLAATVGNIQNAISAGSEFCWDLGTSIQVKLLSTTAVLESKTEAEVLAGANRAAIKCANGQWEIIQWQTATLIADRTYTLTVLLRSRYGTEEAMNAGAVSGAEFVVLSNAYKTSIGISQRGIETTWKIGPTAKNIADSSYRTAVNTFSGIGLRPLSPTQLQASRNVSTSDVTLSWIPRTRLPESGDDWSATTIALSESSEAYEVDIYNAAYTTVIRTISASTTSCTYTNAQQTSDFGSLPGTLKFTVYQLSATFGRGSGRTAIISLG